MKMHLIRSSQGAPSRGMTLTELLVVLAILSLLATILLPTVVNKVEDARIATAKQEIKAIAQAEEQCASIHGFYVPFQVLDDLNPNVFGASGNSPNATVVPDILSNEREDQIFLIDPNRNLQNQVDSSTFQAGGQAVLADRHSIPRIESMYEYWGGPFVEFRRYFQPSDIQNVSNNDVRRDYPLDPWGQPYRFYSPYGIIGNGANQPFSSSWNNDSAFDGRLQRGTSFYDRFAVVSFGPDNLTQGVGGGGSDARRDDLHYTFGGLFTESSFRAFY